MKQIRNFIKLKTIVGHLKSLWNNSLCRLRAFSQGILTPSVLAKSSRTIPKRKEGGRTEIRGCGSCLDKQVCGAALSKIYFLRVSSGWPDRNFSLQRLNMENFKYESICKQRRRRTWNVRRWKLSTVPQDAPWGNWRTVDGVDGVRGVWKAIFN